MPFVARYSNYTNYSCFLKGLISSRVVMQQGCPTSRGLLSHRGFTGGHLDILADSGTVGSDTCVSLYFALSNCHLSEKEQTMSNWLHFFTD